MDAHRREKFPYKFAGPFRIRSLRVFTETLAARDPWGYGAVPIRFVTDTILPHSRTIPDEQGVTAL